MSILLPNSEIMLEQLINLVRQNADDAIVKNPVVPNELNESAIQDVAAQIFNGLKGQASSGNLQDIVGMFQGNQSSLAGSPMTSQLISNITGSLASKFGISRQAAAGIASSLIPIVMKQFVNKTNDPNDNDFDLQDIVKSVTGKSNVGDILSQFTGGSTTETSTAGNVLGNLFK
jgi:Bacterial protein of unknown function (DUF937)